MSNWICDGVPKDGKDYAGLGGIHEPFNCELPNCEYCGLPQEAMVDNVAGGRTQLSGGAGNNFKIVLSVVITGALLLAGVSAVYFSGLFNDDRHLKTYEEAVAIGEEGLSIIQTHENAEQLAQAQEYLSEAITKLSIIPQKAAIYPEVDAKISTYDTLLTQITDKLNSSKFELCVDPKPKKCIF